MDIKKFESTEEYLNQVIKLSRTINNKMLELKQLEEIAYSLHSANCEQDKVQTSVKADKIGDSIVKIEEAKERLSITINEYLQIKEKITHQIESLDNELYYEILFYRYIALKDNKQRYSFEEISIKINNSYRNTTRLRRKALIEFERKFGNEYLKKCP